jgi:hypothetical protein
MDKTWLFPQLQLTTTQCTLVRIVRGARRLLSLDGGNFYVGRTNDPDRRFAEHVEGGIAAAAWTRLHPPVAVVRTIPHTHPFHENQVTHELMLEHGIDRVRGGAYTMVVLPFAMRRQLQHMLWHEAGVCARCGRPDHFLAECEEAHDVNGQLIPDAVPGGPFAHFGAVHPPINHCARCGRDGHTVAECFAATHADGRRLPLVCTRCGRDSHDVRDCFAAFHVDGRRLGPHW